MIVILWKHVIMFCCKNIAEDSTYLYWIHLEVEPSRRRLIERDFHFADGRILTAVRDEDIE